MKKFMLALLAATGLAGAAQAQPAPTPAPSPPTCAQRVDADPAMWTVRDADTTIYLFGTFHLLDACRDWFNDEVRTAFDASQELVVEVQLPESPAEQAALMQPLLMRLGIDPQGRGILSRLNDQEDAQLRALLGPATDMLDQAKFEPWFINLSLTNVAAQQLGLNPAAGPEAALQAAARQRNLPIHSLETIEFQFGIFDGMSDESQLRGLRELLANPNRIRETLQPMLAAWSSGNVDQLASILTEGTRDDRATYDALFTNRNATWARWIQQRLARPGTVFIAVGGGHLGGPGSVQEQLQRLGIRTARVPAAR